MATWVGAAVASALWLAARYLDSIAIVEDKSYKWILRYKVSIWRCAGVSVLEVAAYMVMIDIIMFHFTGSAVVAYN